MQYLNVKVDPPSNKYGEGVIKIAKLLCCLLCVFTAKSSWAMEKEVPLPPATYTVFSPASTPANALINDGSGIELGMKIRTSQKGLITALRYYKGAGTTGTHKGHIWSSAGVMLAEATFTSETSSGWQQVALSTPLAIDTGITYIASYHSQSGDYAITAPFFTSSVNNGGPIRALADGEDGGNGLYAYASSSTVPNSTFNSSNYWVDVVFVPTVSDVMFSGSLNYIPKFASSSLIENSILFENGEAVGVGTMNIEDSSYRLFVEKGIRTRKVKVDQANWPDYVFEKKYVLMPLSLLEQYIKTQKHLPDVPPAEEVEKEGLNIGDNQAVLLRKIEELTLYLLQLNKEIEQLKEDNKKLKQSIRK